MLLETSAAVSLRSLLELRFNLPEVGDELGAIGTVVRQLKGPPARIGIRFLGFTGDSEEQIRGVLAAVPPERTFGRYEPIGLIGEGSMGRVYRAFDPAAQRVVAIKTLKPEHLAAEGAEKELQRFRREAQAAARLVHPNIVTIFDVGDDYFVMELLEGTTLQALIREQGRLELEQAAEILAPVARALDFAHARGTIHQDVKPANIVITRSGRVKLMDFGLAHAATGSATGSGRFFGSPAYMAPEQITGDSASQQSDVYSLAVAAYEALTGHRPFEGLRVSHVLQGALSLTPPPPSAWNPVLAPEFDEIFGRALAKDPELRFPTATALVAALFPSAAITDREAGSSVAAPTLRVESSDPDAETMDLRDDRPLERLSSRQPDD
jgi:serine/threonine-protein kinase